MKHPKLNAFTLMETIVALVLTALLISLAYASLRLIQRQAGLLRGQTGGLNEATRLSRALQADAKHSRTLFMTVDGVTFDSGTEQISYQIMDSLLLRHTAYAAPDTFLLRADSLQGWFNGRPQVPEDGRPADEVFFYINNQAGKQLSFSVIKQYDAALLMQLTEEKP